MSAFAVSHQSRPELRPQTVRGISDQSLSQHPFCVAVARHLPEYLSSHELSAKEGRSIERMALTLLRFAVNARKQSALDLDAERNAFKQILSRRGDATTMPQCLSVHLLTGMNEVVRDLLADSLGRGERGIFQRIVSLRHLARLLSTEKICRIDEDLLAVPAALGADVPLAITVWMRDGVTPKGSKEALCRFFAFAAKKTGTELNLADEKAFMLERLQLADKLSGCAAGYTVTKRIFEGAREHYDSYCKTLAAHPLPGVDPQVDSHVIREFLDWAHRQGYSGVNPGDLALFEWFALQGSPSLVTKKAPLSDRSPEAIAARRAAAQASIESGLIEIPKPELPEAGRKTRTLRQYAAWMEKIVSQFPPRAAERTGPHAADANRPEEAEPIAKEAGAARSRIWTSLVRDSVINVGQAQNMRHFQLALDSKGLLLPSRTEGLSLARLSSEHLSQLEEYLHHYTENPRLRRLLYRRSSNAPLFVSNSGSTILADDYLHVMNSQSQPLMRDYLCGRNKLMDYLVRERGFSLDDLIMLDSLVAQEGGRSYACSFSDGSVRSVPGDSTVFSPLYETHEKLQGLLERMNLFPSRKGGYFKAADGGRLSR